MGSGTSMEKILASEAVNFRFQSAISTQNKADYTPKVALIQDQKK